MDPRMKEKGIPVQPENNFQIRNPYLPTPGNPIGSRSNGISFNRDGNNQLERRNWNHFFNLLETPNSNLNKPLNQSSSSYGMSENQMGTGIMHGGNNLNHGGTIHHIRGSNGTGDHIPGINRSGNDPNIIRVQNQISNSNSTASYQTGNEILRGGNTSYLTDPINQINSLNGHIGNGIVRGGNSSNFIGILNQNRNSNNLIDRQMRNEIMREGSNLNLTGTANQGSSLNRHIGDGIIRGGNSSNFTGILNQNSSSNSLGNRRMGNENLQGGNNFIFTAQKNRVSSSDGHIENEIIRGGNSSNFTGMLNQNSPRSMGDYRMGNEILRSSNNFHPTGQMNQIRSSNGAVDYIGNEIIRGGNSYNLTETTRQISSFKSLGEHQMGNGIMRGSNNLNLTGITNQISTSYGTGEHTENGIIRGGSKSSVPRTLNQISSSNSIGDHRMGSGIMQRGNNFNLNKSMVQFRSSNSNGDHIGIEIMQGDDNSTFTGLLNQISSSNSMGNESLGHSLNSQSQTFHNDIPHHSKDPMALNRESIENTVQKSSFLPKNTPPIIIANTNTSSPVLNLNMQPLSSPRVKNTPNAPLILNSYSEVNSSWTEGNFTSLLLGDEIPELGPNNFLDANNSLQMLNNGFSVPALQDNNLNSPARIRDANSFPFAPITPDHRTLFEKQQQAPMLKFLADAGSCQEQDKMQNLLSPIQEEAIENHCSELLQTIVSSASTVLSAPQVENKITEERGDQDVIDLNDTPKQKTPKRRKHRPKVVREGKPQRIPKPKTPKNGESEETPSRKRKYVRKNRESDVEIVTPLQTDAAKAPIKSRKESIRKRLNFDLGKSEIGESQYTAAMVQVAHHQGNQTVLDLNLNYPANQMQVESLAGEESHVSAAPAEIITYNPSNEMTRNSKLGNNENRENKSLQGESNKNIPRSNINIERSMRWKSTHQMVERDVGNFQGFCGSKGEETNPTEQVGPSSEHKLGSSAMSQEPFRSENQETASPNVGSSSEEKKQKVENDFQTMLCEPEREHSTNGTHGESTINDENHRKLTSSKQQKVQKRTKKKMSRKSAQAQSTGGLVVMPNSDLQSEITLKNVNTSGYQQESEQCQVSTQNDRHKVTPNPCRVISFSLQGHNDTSHLYRQPSMKARGQPKSMKYSKKTVDEITNRLEALTISCHSEDTDGKDKYALVPYEGGGTMVPYEAKKRKPRPKVDLDPETNRIWKLLMGKEGCEASEAENKDKEKWWEEERRVFHGRAESFIARMHLVQGDRRFSPWKGSVVDSIIGVFLTQNVSDQLSSSAFMALAAQFPLGSNTPDQSGTSILTEDLEIQGLAPYGTTGCFEKTTRQPLYSQNSETYLGSLGTGRTGLATDMNRITQENSSSPQNSSDSSVHHINGEIHSSSGSSSEAEDASNGGKSIKNNGLTGVQHTDRTAPLQVIDSMNSFSPLSHPIHSSISNMQNATMPPSYFQMLMASQVARSDVNCFDLSREECRPFHSRAPEMMSDTLFQQNGLQKSQTPNIDPFAFLTKHQTVQKSIVQQESQIGKDPQVEKSRIYEPEHLGFNNPIRPIEPVIKRKSGSGNQLPNVSNHTGQAIDIQEGTTAANKQVFLGDSGETNIGISTKTLNVSQNRDKEKRESFDWDSLRKMVHSNREKIKERSTDSSDSMDYEAMRCADVNIISNSIRMRGMNHMLAERIKDFLNRVATDHGSIDLEWLRDAPPDKVKDYLLSIRGLGLKSVECVRLLTLHHLAFPVDTNVGRIAVRLGWVPIQPLPESLQLHLLEMYPVLESVQKYLWPRLCKLDQKTLYELHYQLITFGKVFCTKSKPNCNACPMRGECRHFASAFASARLALPAPEEKGIVSSTMPITTDTRADVAVKPMLLQPPGKNGEKELMVSRCEPIIEEPASPEPEFTEITEADIEDAFYEDPDEIPTIRLNVEQLAVNLRNFMEEHTDLQEGDMSKALVALTPEVASIPMPKLKYVLRLRTERQVYVLPDTHPLIKGLDKREQDDPSPYLLALLTPGEETNSGQSSREPDNEKDHCSVNEEENSLTVRGTLLIPCRTAMRGSFPLNGTYFQVNEVFADHESSLNPIDVPRAWLWHLEMRTVFFGTSATSIFRGMTTKEIQNSFWRGFVCVRGFDQKTRAPRPLNRNLHIPQSKTVKTSKTEL